MKGNKKRVNYRNSFILAGSMTFLVSVFSLYSLYKPQKLLDSNELVYIKGTLKNKLAIHSDGKNHKSIDIAILEYPNKIFSINYSSYSSIPNPEELTQHSNSGDSVLIGIHKEDYETKVTNTTQSDYLSSSIFVFTISINNMEYSSVDTYNQNSMADDDSGKYALPVISVAFLVMTIYYRRKLANA
jgi:hypothetical protein